jgi:hypothetical protein
MPRPRFGRWLVALFLLGIAAAAPAQTSLTWTGGGGADTSWTNAANWGGTGYPNNGQPNPGDIYNVTISNVQIPTLNADVTVNNCTCLPGPSLMAQGLTSTDSRVRR